MSVRNLDYLLKPRSVAVIGASTKPRSVGAVLARNLFSAGFEGPVLPVNPRHEAIEGVLTYPSVAELPLTPDLAVIATPPETVPGLIAEVGARGTKAAVVITAGFGEGAGGPGRGLRQQALDAAKPHCLRVLGPNCLGLMIPGLKLNATFAHKGAAAGGLAFVAQSGAVTVAVLDWAASRGIGFSHLISVGDMADVDFGDLLDYLALDTGAQAILLYMEAIKDARKFMSAARAAARGKPVVVVKTGRFEAGKQAAASHTGALAGSDAAYDAAFNRAGLLRVRDLDELFDSVETLALARPPSGDRLAILTNGGGFGVLATDALVEAGGRLAELSPRTRERLDKVLPPTWSHGNPVDIIGDADGARYKNALAPLLEDKDVDAVLVLNCPTAIASSTEAAEAVAGLLGASKKCVLTSWIGGDAVKEARALLARNRIPSYPTPGQAARAFLHMVSYRRNQELLMETPPSAPGDLAPDTEGVRAVIEQALAAGRQWLSEPEAKSVLAAYGIPVTAIKFARTPKEAAAQAAALAVPVALKILSPDILHKSDVGGVMLDLPSPGAVREAADAMLKRVAEREPKARIEGLVVEPMIRRPGAFELIVGLAEDSQFGPLILFGQGGTAVEVVGDTALGLPPLNMKLARDLMARTRIYKQLVGFRAQPPADLEAIAYTLVKVSQLAVDNPEIAELDINPLIADEYGVMVLDARVRVQKAPPGDKAARFAIRPYPSGLAETVTLADGTEVVLRPVRPEDEPAFQSGFAKLTPEDVRMRFFVHMRQLPHDLAARLTQIDYDREMALVAFLADGAKPAEAVGVVRLMADPDNRRGEYAVVVRSDYQRRGLGRILMDRIVAYARKRGISEIFGFVMEENRAMLSLCAELGFAVRKVADERGVAAVSLRLDDRPC